MKEFFYFSNMLQNYFLIGFLIYLFEKEFREWIELILSYKDENKEEETEPIPENVKHMYS